jgi:hypothetical protein
MIKARFATPGRLFCSIICAFAGRATGGSLVISVLAFVVPIVAESVFVAMLELLCVAVLLLSAAGFI